MNKQTAGRRLTNKEIAAPLSVTSAAVKKRLESVYAKLDVHTRREAVAAAVARGGSSARRLSEHELISRQN